MIASPYLVQSREERNDLMKKIPHRRLILHTALAVLAVPDHSQLFDAVEYETEINELVDPRYLGKIQ